MIACAEELRYRYPRAAESALVGSSFGVGEGEFLLLAGPSAGGKSTLLRALNGLVPQFYGGRYGGSVRVAGLDPAHTPARLVALVAGMVFQEPESQAVAETVEEELAFGLEQRCIARAEMERRISESLETVGIAGLRGRRLSTLSGGERQRVAIAAVLALRARLLLLDEPTSQLDPAGADGVIEALHRARERLGTTVLLAEHRLRRLLPAADRVLLVEQGLVTSAAPAAAAAALASPPGLVRLGTRLGLLPIPLTVDEARSAIVNGPRRPRVSALETPAHESRAGGVLLEGRGLSVTYDGTEALRAVSLTLREGEVVALVGPNGSGKTSLLRAFTGLARVSAGEVLHRGSPAPPGVAARTAFAGLCPQNPAHVLSARDVRSEIASTLRSRRSSLPLEQELDRWGLQPLASRSPRELSVGQQQRLAIAAMLAHRPPVWLLDEPTRGADAATRAWLAQHLQAHTRAGGGAIVATHDLEAAATFATRVIGLDGGRLVFDLPVDQALGSAGPYPTDVARVVPGAVRPEDVSW